MGIFQHAEKNVTIAQVHGTGRQHIMRTMYDPCGCVRAQKSARYLGPHFHLKTSSRPEINLKVKAGWAAWTRLP